MITTGWRHCRPRVLGLDDAVDAIAGKPKDDVDTPIVDHVDKNFCSGHRHRSAPFVTISPFVTGGREVPYGGSPSSSHNAGRARSRAERNRADKCADGVPSEVPKPHRRSYRAF